MKELNQLQIQSIAYWNAFDDYKEVKDHTTNDVNVKPVRIRDYLEKIVDVDEEQ